MGINNDFSNRKILCSAFGLLWFAVIWINIINVIQHTSMKAADDDVVKNNDSLHIFQVTNSSSTTAQQSQLDAKGEQNHEKPNVSSVDTKSSTSSVPPAAGIAATTVNTSTIPKDTAPVEGGESSLLPNFQRYEGVVIVTKVLKGEDAEKVIRMLCFLQHGFNDRTKYDIVVFTTMPWNEEDIAKVQQVVAPAKLTVAVEGPPLEEQVAAMTPEEREFLYRRCNVAKDQNITWYNYCAEEGSNNVANLGYAWQAEFRSYHIWNHDAIKDYKYMMWFDSE
jgi:hypothetical protein